MSRYETVLWDLDGTIINSFSVFYGVLSEISPNHGLLLPPQDEAAKHFHGSLSDSINGIYGGLDQDLLATVFDDFLEKQDGHYLEVEQHIFDDALMLAERMAGQGLHQVIVTNREHAGRKNASPRSIVERSSLGLYVQDVVSGDDSEFRKPEPMTVERIMRAGKLKPETTLVIGDQFIDAEFARNLGASAVIVCRNGEPPHMDRLGADYGTFVTLVPDLTALELI